MGRQRLKEDAARVRTMFCSIDAEVGGAVRRLSLEDESVHVQLDGPGATAAVTIVYADADSYPGCPVLLLSDDDTLAGKLEGISERFMERAPLASVLRALCTALGASMDGTDEMEGDNASSASEAADGDAEIEDASGCDSDGDLTYAEAEDDALLSDVLQQYSRWEAHDVAMRAAAQGTGDEAGAAMAAEERAALRSQIFDQGEAFRMLSKELIAIVKGHMPGMAAAAVDNDVYHWHVWLSGFDPASLLGQELGALSREHGSSGVQLGLRFKRGLYPFFPPSVELLGPRFSGPLHYALCAHPLVSLQRWDPCRTVGTVLTSLKAFIQSYGRLDPASPRSALFVHGAGSAYTPLEASLCKLEALTRVKPLWADAQPDLYSGRAASALLVADGIAGSNSGGDVEADTAAAGRENGAGPEAAAAPGGEPGGECKGTGLQQQSKRLKSASPARASTAWAKGTGYGYAQAPAAGGVWDPKAAAAAQQAADADVMRLLDVIKSQVEGSLACSGGGDAEDIAACCESLHSSCLVPWLTLQLGHASFTDMTDRQEYYHCLLSLMELLCAPQTGRLLSASCGSSEGGTGPDTTLGSVISQLNAQATTYLRVRGGRVEASRATAPSGSGGGGAGRSKAAEQSADAAAAAAALRLAKLIKHTHDRLVVSVGEPASAPRSASGAEAGASAAGSSDSERYAEALRPYQVDFVAGLATHHHYKNEAAIERVAPNARVARVARELAALKADLPLSPSSSVFVRVDEANMVLWRVLITGPDATPYSNGAFLFDLYFPPSYPAAPPKVNLMTTGGGRVRFNPNLYNCGKVCLSLLGTWRGGAGEGWSERTSTVLQVLLSIQSMILGTDAPYFNEPGYEKSMHSAEGQLKSRQYNANIRKECMAYAMIDLLRKPPPEFKEVLQHHFGLRRQHVLDTCQAWLREAAQRGERDCAGAMEKHLANLQALLPVLAEVEGPPPSTP